MLADGKSLDDKRNLLVDQDLFEAFSFGEGAEALTEAEQKSLHDNFNLPDIIKRYADRNTEAERNRSRTEQSFTVPFKEIKENDWDLSINRYKEMVYEEVVYDMPEVILDRIENLNNKRAVVLQKLKNLK